MKARGKTQQYYMFEIHYWTYHYSTDHFWIEINYLNTWSNRISTDTGGKNKHVKWETTWIIRLTTLYLQALLLCRLKYFVVRRSRSSWPFRNQHPVIKLTALNADRDPRQIMLRADKTRDVQGWGLLSQFTPFRNLFFLQNFQNFCYHEISRSYLTGVTAAKLRRHLSNINVIEIIYDLLFKFKNINNRGIKDSGFSNPHAPLVLSETPPWTYVTRCVM